MNRKTFLKKLADGLDSCVDEQKRNDIIKKYDDVISKEISSGKKEKDVVAALGDIGLIIKLNTEQIKDEPNKSSLLGYMRKGVTYLYDYLKDLDEDLVRKALIIICFSFIGIVFLSVLRVPFILVDYSGRGIFNLLIDNYWSYKLISSLWSISIGLTYLILCVWLIVHYINEIILKFTNRDMFNEKIHKEIKDDIKEVNAIHNFNSVASILYLIMKIFIILLTIPLVIVEIGLFMLLFFSISLIVNGIYLWGPIMIIVGLILLTGILVDLPHYLLNKGGIK